MAAENKIDIEVKGILDAAYGRYQAAEKNYGVLDIDKDPRDFLKEAEEELLDLIMYAAFEIAKIRNINSLINKRMQAILPNTDVGKACISWPGVGGF